MSIKKVETQLNELEIDSQLATAAGLDAINTWILQTSKYELGFTDDFIPDTDLTVEIHGGGRIIYHPDSESITTVYFFQHSGIALDQEFIGLMDFSAWKPIAETIYINYDRGTRTIADRLAEKMVDDPQRHSYAIVFFDISRVMCDSNRITRQEQMVDQAYRGDSLWKPAVEKEVVGEKLIDPLFAAIEKFVKERNPKFLFYMHSYDRFGGGKASGGHEKNSGFLERPPSMIFNHHHLTEDALGIYGDQQNIELDLLTKEQVEIIQQVQFEQLATLKPLQGQKFEVPMDYPYASPRQFPLLASTYFTGPQLVLEYRKDLFRTGMEEIMKSVGLVTKQIEATVKND